MPLKPKYAKIKREMIKEYGKKKGTSVFYAWVNEKGIKNKVEAKSAYSFASVLKPELKDGKVEGTYGTLIDTNYDFFKDVATKECLQDLAAQLKNRPITVDEEHENWREGERNFVPVAKINEAKYVEDGNEARVEIKDELNKDNSKYEEVSNSIENGFINAYSIAFNPEEFEYVKDPDGEEVRVLNKVNLLNVGYTGSPVNPRATMKEVFLNSLLDADVERIVEKIDNKGGLSMAEEKEKAKTEEDAEEKVEKKAEETEKEKTVEEEKVEKKAEDKEEPEDAENKPDVDVKSLTDKLESNEKAIAELKASVDKILELPQFKAKSEEMKEELEKAEKKSKEDETPLSLIK